MLPAVKPKLYRSHVEWDMNVKDWYNVLKMLLASEIYKPLCWHISFSSARDFAGSQVPIITGGFDLRTLTCNAGKNLEDDTIAVTSFSL